MARALSRNAEMLALPRIRGVIRRRILVNFRVDPRVIARELPKPFEPKLHAGSAVAGICLIRLEHIRPRPFPSWMGFGSENAAHRIAVVWQDASGEHEGVYIPRRDSSSLMNHLAGGRLFPGEHHRARFEAEDTGNRIGLSMRAVDGEVSVQLEARATETWPTTSRFSSLEEASRFFEGGSLGYSATAARDHLDGITLVTKSWKVAPLAVDHVYSSYFADRSRYPKGTVDFDCALLMRDIDHEWVSAPELPMSRESSPR